MTGRLTSLPRRVAVRGWRVVGFAGYFSYEFVKSNVVVLREILAWPGRSRAVPGIVAIPLRCRSHLEIVSLANLLTLTPGTLVIEVALGPPMLYVHGMFTADPDDFTDQIRRLEDRLLRALRPVGAEVAG